MLRELNDDTTVSQKVARLSSEDLPRTRPHKRPRLGPWPAQTRTAATSKAPTDQRRIAKQRTTLRVTRKGTYFSMYARHVEMARRHPRADATGNSPALDSASAAVCHP